MQRRLFLRNTGTIAAALPLIHLAGSDFFQRGPLSADDISKLKIGKLKLTFFRDTLHKYAAKRFFSNALPDELNNALSRYKITPDNIPSPFIPVLIEQGNQKILIDTGTGFTKETAMVDGSPAVRKGKLQELLHQERKQAADITDVIITHLHPDHIGGIYSEAGDLLFPNARFYIHEDEWAYWHSSQSDKQPAMFRYFIDKNITKLKNGKLHLFKGDFVELLPGITAVKTDGHTPGHIALIAHSKKEKLLYISDAFLHPLHIERLDWQTSYDLDHEKAKQSRIKLLELAYKEDMQVNAFHFNFPGLGRIDKHNNNWVWNYTEPR